MKNIYRLLTIGWVLFLIFFNQSLYANCSINNTLTPQSNLFPNSGSLSSTIIAQSFNACETSQLRSIVVETSGGNIDLFLARGTAANINTSSVYQSFSGMPAGVVTLNLTTPLNVSTDELITFGILGPAQVRLDVNPPMPVVGGTDEILSFISGGTTTPQTASDLFFRANIAPPPLPLIPTMNEWGLLIFGLLLLNLCGIFIKRTEQISMK